MTSFRTLLVSIEASGPMQWFVNLLEELGSTCQVGEATKCVPRSPASKNLIDAMPS
jgi:hypothetical protein